MQQATRDLYVFRFRSISITKTSIILVIYKQLCVYMIKYVDMNRVRMCKHAHMFMKSFMVLQKISYSGTDKQF